MEKLDTADAKKLALLRKWDPATHDAVLWLRGNKDKFKMEVLEPPILSVTVKDPNFTALVEAGFPGTQMRVRFHYTFASMLADTRSFVDNRRPVQRRSKHTQSLR